MEALQGTGRHHPRVGVRSPLDGSHPSKGIPKYQRKNPNRRNRMATEYDHDAALAKRDKALGEAFEAAMSTHQPIIVYHKDGQYKTGPESEWRAVLKDGWMSLAEVSV